ncbi:MULTISPECIES: FtsH protease activity modulator HflK [Methylobacter]|jgi:modulator of FtsH protease HflK|uniref:FtsH protease activity modulator HflK n=1 Tax=Methylobacter TaxID=429 RepID=UPI00048651C3|nr:MULTISPECIES: FtsH protease activity modulator HflK [Methylobacter]
MSWNEPGGDKKDPWSGRGDQKGPPDLDEAIRSLQEKLGGIFGGGRGGGEGSSGGSMKGLGLLAVAALVLWGLSGFYIVDEGNHGVETRFGKYTATTQAGLNWHFPVPIEQVEIVNVRQQRYIEVGYRSAGSDQALGSVPKEALMLTKDENIVDVRLAVQYQVKDAKQFLFNVVNPTATLKQVTESAERGVVGSSKMDFVLTEGRSEIVAQVKKEIQDILDNYQAGIQVTSVNLQDAQPPEQVQSAFEDAIKAREDQQRLINEAEAYSNDVVPKARGAAARRIQEAEGYKEQVIAQAEGEADRFSRLLAEYRKAPEVTRQRLYLESMEAVLGDTNTVMVDVKDGNNVLYLPIDKMIQQPSSSQQTQVPQSAVNHSGRTAEVEQPALRTSTRGRDGRGR